MPEVREGDSITDLIIRGVESQGVGLQDGDIVVVTSKVVSKALGYLVDISRYKRCKTL